ncbi:MAG: hypothetical protein Q7S12_04640 [bacterium]|nr:hypothetical protein [bacterium]
MNRKQLVKLAAESLMLAREAIKASGLSNNPGDESRLAAVILAKALRREQANNVWVALMAKTE